MSAIEARVAARVVDVGRAYPDLEPLPPEAPLAMPTQRLDEGGSARPVRAERLLRRRAALLIWTVVTTLIAVGLGMQAFAADRLTAIEVMQLVLFGSLFAWTSFAFASAAAGFFVSLRSDPTPRKPVRASDLTTRTAILAPIYNEDPAPVFARLQAMTEALQAQGAGAAFDLFILSDTRDLATAVRELEHHQHLQQHMRGQVGVYYRRRAINTDRKAGNVADWVRRFGDAYEHMVVLDADSLMTGETLVRLSLEMQGRPGCGLIQTVPALINGRTVFARAEQFASRLYGPMFARGLDWWSGAESNYWGHNAIIRVAAFAGQAGLPHLRGPAPLGGHILSHDFVEAALMRRGGWEIRLAADIDGSYEEGPPSLVDQMVRDRRWCQGNLQHLGVVGARGLHPLSRFHLLRGFSTYFTAPLWLALLTIGLMMACFPELGGALPGGELSRPAAIALWSVFGLSVGFLIAPKLMAAILVVRGGAVAGFGGVWRLLVGIATEIGVSTLTAPVILVAQTTAIVQVISGRDSGWAAQQRNGRRLSLRAALRLHRVETALGVALLGLCVAFEPRAAIWVAIPSLALAGAFVVSSLTARPAGRMRLLATPELHTPPAILRRALALTGEDAPSLSRPMRVRPTPVSTGAVTPPVHATI